MEMAAAQRAQALDESGGSQGMSDGGDEDSLPGEEINTDFMMHIFYKNEEIQKIKD